MFNIADRIDDTSRPSTEADGVLEEVSDLEALTGRHSPDSINAMNEALEGSDSLPAQSGSTDQPHEDSSKTSLPPFEQCRELAYSERILDRFADELANFGVVGEGRAAKLIYLAVTSRLLEKPVSVVVKGPSSGGKSYVTNTVLKFFPDTAYYALTAMSEKSLAYNDKPLRHRFLVIYEASGINGFGTYLLRSLLSEGCVRYVTVESVKDGGLKPKEIVIPGPTGLLTTTTAAELHRENETRMFSVPISDTREQTSAILMASVEEGSVERRIDSSWISLQAWLERAGHRVTLPFGRRLAKCVPAVAVRLRRDFPAMLNLVKTHAILHQAKRQRDSKGWIVGTLDDYTVVYDLVADLIAERVGASVSPIVKETVEAVRSLLGKQGNVEISHVATQLGIDKSAAFRRIRVARSDGYLINQEWRRGYPARLILGEPLPQECELLPRPDDTRLTGCTVDRVSEGVWVGEHATGENHFSFSDGDSATANQSRVDKLDTLGGGESLTASADGSES